MKVIFILIFTSLLLFSFDAYKENSNGLCFYNLIYEGSNITSTTVSNGTQYTITRSESWYQANATEAFYYNDVCNDEPELGSNQDWLELNMKEEDYNLMMALTANFLGFTLVFLVGFLFILQGRR